jgi:hypothetical protein
MGFFSDRFIETYKGHKIEIEGHYEDLSKGKLKFRLIIDNELADEVYLQFGSATLRAKEIKDSNKSRPPIVVLVKQYFWASAMILDGKDKIKMRRAH